MTLSVKLVRHTFPDDPDWILVEQIIPLGTTYRVLGYYRDGFIRNDDTGKERNIELLLLIGNGDFGWLPAACFEFIEENYDESKTENSTN